VPGWRHFTRGLRGLFHSAAADREVGEEVEHYLREAVDELVARGVTPDEARRTVRLEFGTAIGVSERARDYGWERAIGTFAGDLRYACRQLGAQPGFTAVTVLTLALGIGATTAIFSAVNPILFEPLPYPGARRVVMISDSGPNGAPQDVTFGTYLEVLARNRAFDAVAVVKAWQPALVGRAEPERLTGQRVSAGFFRTLGVLPAIGRDFTSSDDRVNGPRVIVIGDGLWRRRFAADPAILGHEVTLDDRRFEVIGIMPAGFENVLAPSAELWAPLQYDTVLTPDGREWGHHLRMIGRLRAGATLDRGRADLAAIAQAPRPEFPRVPWASLGQGLIVDSLQAEVTRGVRPALLAVLGAVVLLLAIACVNVTNLLLARGARRRGEFAMRAALGAGRARLTRQVLTESLLLAVIGGVLGMAIAEAGVRVLVAMSPPGLPRVGAIRLDATVFAFGFAITTVIGIVVGAIPALQASRADLQSGMQQSGRRATGHGLTRGTLVIVEVALAIVLLVSAGLLLRSLDRLFAVDPGFDPSHLLTLQVQASGAPFTADDSRAQFFTQIVAEIQRLPGVESAALTSQLPLSGDLDGYGIHLESRRELKDISSALRYAVSPGYLETMRIPLRRGRRIDARDGAAAPRVAMINETFAARMFADRDPIGQRIRIGSDEGQPYTIVGVAGDVRQTSLAMDVADAIYVTMPQWHWVDTAMSVVIRTRGDAAALAPAARSAIWSIDRNRPIVRVTTMDSLLAKSEAGRHFTSLLFEAFGLAALLLAAIGIYGVLSGSVAERTREIGVRAALGASRRDILGLVARQGLTLTAIGTAFGLAGAAAASSALVTLLFGISHLDPMTYGGVVTLLVAVATAAGVAPAWRAARIDPAITLRSE
jgi:putative ABC transport system permease protein